MDLATLIQPPHPLAMSWGSLVLCQGNGRGPLGRYSSGNPQAIQASLPGRWLPDFRLSPLLGSERDLN